MTDKVVGFTAYEERRGAMTKGEQIREMGLRVGRGDFNDKDGRIMEGVFKAALLAVTHTSDSPFSDRVLHIATSWFQSDLTSRTMLYLDIMEGYHRPLYDVAKEGSYKSADGLVTITWDANSYNVMNLRGVTKLGCKRTNNGAK